MRDDEAVWLAVGVGVVLVMRGSGPEWGGGWVWPVPTLVLPDAQYPAVVSDGFGPGKRDGGKRAHAGVDVMYKRRTLVDQVAPYPPGTRLGSTRFFAPTGTPILAARDARVWSVKKTPRGIAVVLDHGKPWATFYTHLASTALDEHEDGKRVERAGLVGRRRTDPQLVMAGEVIGTMGHDPTGNAPTHLHFECWYKGAGSDAAVDPEKAMARWRRQEWQP